MEEDTYRAEVEKVTELITRFGGVIEKVDEWGRRKLAYPIAKLTEGMYSFITYSSPSSTPKEVESRLRLMETLLRFMTVCKEDIIVPAAVETTETIDAETDVEEPAETPIEESLEESTEVNTDE